MKKFWKWKNQITNSEEAEPTRVLEIDGIIAEDSWFDDDVTPKMFKEELMSGSGDIVLYINSPGGDCIAASQIYTMLMEYKGNVTVKIDGIAASAASVVAMAGTTVLMAPTAVMMIHNPSMLAWGDHNEMSQAIEILDQVKESIINAYELKTERSRAKISQMMEEETWMNAKKAIELGFADGMIVRDGESDETTAVAFSNVSFMKTLTNKISAKAEAEAEKPAEPAKQGAKVSDLVARLYEIKN